MRPGLQTRQPPRQPVVAVVRGVTVPELQVLARPEHRVGEALEVRHLARGVPVVGPHRAGNVVQRFTPDFYLPMYDLYIEITTLNQRLVTKKNRKVRRLRELAASGPHPV